jgi:3-oxoadipate CoA-transferase beta subunit
MAAAAAGDLVDGTYVNLGIGLPTLVTRALPSDREVVLHSENGILGAGPPPEAGDEDWDLIDAGKQPISLVPGGSYFSHADSFAMIRGGHLDVAILGAYQVSAAGDVANWHPGAGIPAVGGAMDLAVGARSVWVLMWHNDQDGRPKVLAECTLPVTGRGVVDRLYTDLGVFGFAGGSLVCRRLAPGVDRATVQDRTGTGIVFDDKEGQQ